MITKNILKRPMMLPRQTIFAKRKPLSGLYKPSSTAVRNWVFPNVSLPPCAGFLSPPLPVWNRANQSRISPLLFAFPGRSAFGSRLFPSEPVPTAPFKPKMNTEKGAAGKRSAQKVNQKDLTALFGRRGGHFFLLICIIRPAKPISTRQS